MYLKSLYLKNLRCFREANLAFQYPRRAAESDGSDLPRLSNVNLLLGNNGAGKTTVLRAAAMALLAPVLSKSSGFRAYAMVRRTFEGRTGRPPKFAEVEAKVIFSPQDTLKRRPRKSDQTVFLELERVEDEDVISDATASGHLWKEMFRQKSPAFLVLGYGATRRLAAAKEDISGRIKSTQPRYQRVQGLFEEGVSLIPLAWSLSQISNLGRRKQFINLIDQLIGTFYKFEGRIENGEVYFKRGRSHVPMGALSDGFRAYIAWIGDMLYHIYTGCPSGKKLTQNEGVVLLDEVDLHLHPDWQRSVIKTLSETFPSLQFIFTSHSPLVTASLESANVWVMTDESPKQLPNEPIYGLSADQILQSPYFSLDSARPPEVSNELRVLDQRAQSGDREAAVEFMRRLAQGSEQRVFKKSFQRQPKSLRTNNPKSSM